MPGTTKNKQRDNLQVMLWKALGDCDIPGSIFPCYGSLHPPGGIESSQLAIMIEDALWRKHNGTKEYAQKFRMLYSNIKDEKNKALRTSLFDYEISVDELLTKSHEV